MRRAVAGFVLVVGLFAGNVARADDPAKDDVVTVTLGEPRRWSPGFAIVMTVCDDLALVSVEAAGDAVVLTGKKRGKTQCAFYRTQANRRLVTIEVVEAKDEKSAAPGK